MIQPKTAADLLHAELYSLGQKEPEFALIREGIAKRQEELQAYQAVQLAKLEQCYFLLLVASIAALLVFEGLLGVRAITILMLQLTSVLMFFWYRAGSYVANKTHHDKVVEAHEKFMKGEITLGEFWEADKLSLPAARPLANKLLCSFMLYALGVLNFLYIIKQYIVVVAFLLLLLAMLISFKEYFKNLKA